MADIMTKVNSSKLIYNGTIITNADKLGNVQRILPVINEAPNPSGVELKYTNRWDDPTYYTA